MNTDSHGDDAPNVKAGDISRYGDAVEALPALIVRAYKFAGVPDPERLAGEFLRREELALYRHQASER